MAEVTGRRHRPSDAARFTFVAVCCMWLLMPVLLRDTLAQDAVPYVVAGEFVDTDPDLVYAAQGGDLFTLDEPFAERSCELSPPGTDCSSFPVAYVSTPLSLPFARLVALLGADVGILAMRLGAALCLVAGMAALWRRLTPRHPAAGTYLAVTAVLLTPFAMAPLGLGQTSPVLFLAAALGVRGTRRTPRAVGVGAVMAAAVAFKAFPVAMVAVAMWQRRWRLVAATVAWCALLALAALVLVPPSTFQEFVTAAGEISGKAVGNPYNGSIANALHDVIGSFDGTGAGGLALAALVVVGGAAVWLWTQRRADDDTAWALGLLLLLLVNPLVWWHYALVGMAAVIVAVIALRSVSVRHLQLVVALAATTVPISIPATRGFGLPVAQALWMLVAVGVTVALARRRYPTDQRTDSTPVAERSA